MREVYSSYKRSKIQNSFLGTEVTKNVYRSLIVISLTVVFGTFGCVIVAMTDDPSDTENSSMLAGILISSGTAVNFFAYYSMRLLFSSSLLYSDLETH